MFSSPTSVLLAALVACSPSAYAGPADVAKWVEIPVPAAGTPEHDRLIKLVSASATAWAVVKDGDRVVVKSKGDLVSPPRPDFPLAVPEVFELHRNSPVHTEKVSNGWLVGYNEGEWGGAVWWFSADGKRRTKVSDHQVNQFVRTKDGVYAVEGLAHLTSDDGSLVRFEPDAKGAWAAAKVVTLPHMGCAAGPAADGSMVVATSREVVRVNKDGKVDVLAGGHELMRRPTSVVVTPAGVVYVGMTEYVGTCELANRGSGLRLLSPAK